MKREWTDEELLDALDLRAAGVSLARIAKRVGVTRNALAGALFRVDRDSEVLGTARDGTRAADWWRAGLEKRPIEDAEAALIARRILAREARR